MNRIEINKKPLRPTTFGFTLIELIAIIVIIVVIGLMSFGAVTNALKENKRRIIEEYENSIMQAAQTCVETNREDLTVCGIYMGNDFEEKGNVFLIDIKKLESAQYLDPNRKVPDDYYRDEDVIVAEILNDYSIKYYYYIIDVTYTSASCFAFDASTQTITDYYDYEGNNSANPVCPRNVVIPRTINDVEVKIIGEYAFQSNKVNNQLRSVVMPDSLESIETYAFAYNYLTTVIIPPGVKSIASYAFYKKANSNPSLTKIVNLPSKSFFAWARITGGSSYNGVMFGTVNHSNGNIDIVTNPD